MKKRIIGFGIIGGLVAVLLLARTLPSKQESHSTGTPSKEILSGEVVSRPDLNENATTQAPVESARSAALDQPIPGAILKERQLIQADGSILRETIVRKKGKYPHRLVQETLQKDAQLKKFIPIGRTEMVADHVLVHLRDGTSVNRLEELATQLGATLLRALSDGRTFVVQLEAPTLDALADAIEFFGQATHEIAYAEPDYVRHFSKVPNDLMYGDLWGMPKVSASAAWDLTTGSHDVVVAVIDTGMDMDHPDLLANLWSNTGEIPGDGLDNDGNGYVDDTNGWDFGDDDNDPEDGDGHGTHTAGTVGAVGNNASQVVGVCWTVSIMPVKATHNNGEFDQVSYTSDISDSVRYAVRNGAKIISNSYGGAGSSQVEYDAIDYANNQGVIFVAAAGNDASDNDLLPQYPASYDLPNVISVAATDENDNLADFSNYGAGSVDLAAPGVNIVSTYLNGETASLQGTSMACPLVAGALGLYASYDPSITPVTAKQFLLAGVDPVASLQGKVVSGGRLNVQELFINANDTDADGMPDLWEELHGLNPNDPADAALDGDGDFLVNLKEFHNGCIPTDEDSDDDSLIDGWEVEYGFNPLNVHGTLPRLQYLGFNGTCKDTYEIAVQNGYAYVADGAFGLKVLDLSTPENAVLVGSYATAGSAQGVAIDGNYAYVSDAENGLFIIDVSNPADPLFTASLPTPSVKVAVGAGYAYSAGGTNGLRVIDVSTVENPQEVASFTGIGDPEFRVNDVALVGGSVYMALDGGLGQISTSANASTYSVKSISDPVGHRNCTSVFYNGSELYVSLQEYGVLVYNLSKTFLGRWESPGSAEDVYQFDDLIYLADGLKGLQILNGTDLANITKHASYESVQAIGVTVANGYVYMAGKSSGVQVFRSSVDIDEDGMYDGWEMQHFGSLSQTHTNDFDGDGISNWGEYLANLDPTNADQDSDTLVDGFDEVQTYLTDPRTSDTDQDGLSDNSELTTNGVDNIYFTDPLKADTDGDGMSDQWEIDHGLDPTVDDAGNDPDSDGATNLEEEQAATDPHQADTDGDTLPDGWEIDMNLDPLFANASEDPDSDTLTNLDEYNQRLVGPYFGSTNPKKADSDNDGLNDPTEINVHGTDPNNPDTDNDTMPDGWEIDNGLDPLVDDAANDLDGDGLSNYEEFLSGSNPFSSDTDNDGFTDDWERDWNTQATNAADPIVVDDNHIDDPQAYDPTFSNPNEDGSLLRPFDAIQEGIDAAVDGMLVLVTNGYYIGQGNMLIDTQGKSIRVISLNGVADTIIDADGLGAAFVFQSGESSNTVISGFTITSPPGGCADGSCGYEHGIVCKDASSPTITNCYILDCALSGIDCSTFSSPIIDGVQIDGCGVGVKARSGSSPVILNTTVSGCSRGIMAVDSIGLKIIDSVIRDCNGRGISIFNDASCQITRCQILNNLGGITFDGSSPVVDQCTIQGNIAPDYYNFGRATTNIALLAALTPELQDITDADENGAGILLLNNSVLNLKNSVLAQNNAVALDPDYPQNKLVPDFGLGGGLYIDVGCFSTNMNCTYGDNEARRGGGISSHGENPDYIRNTVLWDNLAEDKYVETSTFSTTNLVVGSVQAGVTNWLQNVESFTTNLLVVVDRSTFASLHCRDGAFDVWYCDIEHGNSYVNPYKYVIEQDPLFAASYKLSALSPCIDAGTQYLAPVNDLDGISRPLDGNNDGSSRGDIGAYEYVHAAADSDGDGLLDQAEIDAGTDPTSFTTPPASTADGDGDGIPDAYEILYDLNSTSNDAAADADGDGISNYQEYLNGTAANNEDTDGDLSSDGEEDIAGTNPTDPMSFFYVSDIHPLSGGGSELTFETVLGRIYTVYACTKIGGEWSVLAGGIAGTGSPLSVQDTLAETSCFYKVEVSR